MDTQLIASLGVGGPVITLMSIGMKVLWNALQAEREQNRVDQAAMLPALTQSSDVMRQALDELIRIAARNSP